MKSSSVRYLAKEGVKNVWMNRLMSLASVGVLTACLLLVGFAILFTVNVDNMLGYVETQTDIVIYIKDDATQAQIDDMQADLESDSRLASVRYISKDQALTDTLDQMGENRDLLSGIQDDNFLPASFRISAKDLNNMDDVLRKVEGYFIFDKYQAPTNIAKTVVSLKDTVSVFGAAIIVALIIVSIVIISNTIRASVYARRTEIGIMRHVGATNSFIRIPFIVEGVVLGLFSALIAFLVIWGGYGSLIELLFLNGSPFLQSMYQSIVPFDSIALQLALAFVGSGVATGILGSVTSMRTHLKV